MKKLLALVLVLAMTGITSAAWEIRVGEQYDPAVTEMTVNVSDFVKLGIYRTTATAFLSGDYYALVCDPMVGSITGGAPQLYNTGTQLDGKIDVNFDAQLATAYRPTGGSPAFSGEGMGYAYFNLDSYNEDEGEAPENVPAGMRILDIVFHCEKAGDVTVNLYTLSADFATATLRDSLIIHQIPEPMTMSLLALGGLGLIRRRRA